MARSSAINYSKPLTNLRTPSNRLNLSPNPTCQFLKCRHQLLRTKLRSRLWARWHPARLLKNNDSLKNKRWWPPRLHPQRWKRSYRKWRSPKRRRKESNGPKNNKFWSPLGWGRPTTRIVLPTVPTCPWRLNRNLLKKASRNPKERSSQTSTVSSVVRVGATVLFPTLVKVLIKLTNPIIKLLKNLRLSPRGKPLRLERRSRPWLRERKNPQSKTTPLSHPRVTPLPFRSPKIQKWSRRRSRTLERKGKIPTWILNGTSPRWFRRFKTPPSWLN